MTDFTTVSDLKKYHASLNSSKNKDSPFNLDNLTIEQKLAMQQRFKDIIKINGYAANFWKAIVQLSTNKLATKATNINFCIYFKSTFSPENVFHRGIYSVKAVLSANYSTDGDVMLQKAKNTFMILQPWQLVFLFEPIAKRESISISYNNDFILLATKRHDLVNNVEFTNDFDLNYVWQLHDYWQKLFFDTNLLYNCLILPVLNQHNFTFDERWHTGIFNINFDEKK